MIIVSNTSPIINLAFINSLHILKKYFSKIYIPEAVYQEITINDSFPGSLEVQQSDWIECKKVKNRSLINSLKLELDPGEAEAIALAIELDSDLLIIDERLGRNIAGRLNLEYTGILGILLKAKEKKILSNVKETLDDLIIKAGFRVTDDLYSKILELANEK